MTTPSGHLRNMTLQYSDNASQFHVIPNNGNPAIIEVTLAEQLALAKAELKIARAALKRLGI